VGVNYCFGSCREVKLHTEYFTEENSGNPYHCLWPTGVLLKVRPETLTGNTAGLNKGSQAQQSRQEKSAFRNSLCKNFIALFYTYLDQK
jgi:hypothetical protein